MAFVELRISARAARDGQLIIPGQNVNPNATDHATTVIASSFCRYELLE